MSQDRSRNVRGIPEVSREQATADVKESPGPSSSQEALQDATGVHEHSPGSAQTYACNQSEGDPELAGLDALEDGRPGERPAYPFTTLIRYAIKGSPNGRLLLEDIYNAIQTRYPYFTTAPSGWKNSVRHTLSLMTCFEKVPRLLTEPGKGSYWSVNDSMPHAKPSRVRIRKRKTRTDDDGLPETPRSVPDALHPESPGGESLNGSDQYRRLSPYEHVGGSVRRHSSYIQGSAYDQFSRYNNVDGAPRSYHYDRRDSWVEDDRPHVVGEGKRPASRLGSSHDDSDDPQPTGSVRDKEQEKRSTAIEEPVSSKPIDHRLVLMSELDRLRDAISKRDDLQDEWCRIMTERIRGTGLLDQV